MTETEWLTTTAPTPMLEYLRGRATERQMRLFAVACCRRIWHLLTDDRWREAVRVAEAFADRQATEDELHSANWPVWNWAGNDGYEQALDAVPESGDDWPYEADSIARDEMRAPSACSAVSATNPREMIEAAKDAAEAVAREVQPLRPGAAYERDNPLRRAARSAEVASQVAIVRDIFGNPFSPVTLDPRWRSETVVALAGGIYAERAFDRMPILADALEDAGCDHADILNHCRGDGPHVRGCWVVDLLLGRT